VQIHKKNELKKKEDKSIIMDLFCKIKKKLSYWRGIKKSSPATATENISSSILGFQNRNTSMATTLQSLRFPFHPSVTPPNSHTYPSSIVHYTPKSNTRNKPLLSARASSSPTVAENLGDVSIFTAAGESVMFKDLWDQEQVK